MIFIQAYPFINEFDLDFLEKRYYETSIIKM